MNIEAERTSNFEILESNQRLYEYHRDRLLSCGSSEEAVEQETDDFVMSVMTLDHSMIVRVWNYSHRAGDDHLTGRRKLIDPNLSPEEIYKKRSMLSTIYIPSDLYLMVKQIVCAYDESVNVPLYIYLEKSLRANIRGKAREEYFDPELRNLAWITDDEESDDTVRMPGKKRISTVRRYISGMRKRMLELMDEHAGDPDFDDGKLRGILIKEFNYPLKQKNDLIDILFDLRDRKQDYSFRESNESEDGFEEEYGCENDETENDGPKVKRSKNNYRNYYEAEYDNSQELEVLYDLFIAGFLKDNCDPEERYILQHYVEYSDESRIRLGAFEGLYSEIYEQKFGLDELMDPEEIAIQLNEAFPGAGWDAEGIKLRYNRLISRLKYILDVKL